MIKKIIIVILLFLIPLDSFGRNNNFYPDNNILYNRKYNENFTVEFNGFKINIHTDTKYSSNINLKELIDKINIELNRSIFHTKCEANYNRNVHLVITNVSELNNPRYFSDGDSKCLNLESKKCSAGVVLGRMIRNRINNDVRVYVAYTKYHGLYSFNSNLSHELFHLYIISCNINLLIDEDIEESLAQEFASDFVNKFNAQSFSNIPMRQKN